MVISPLVDLAQLHVGGADACGGVGRGGGASEAAVGFKIPFVVTAASDFLALSAAAGGLSSSSSISGFLGVGTEEGMSTVRGRSFPLEAMLGVDICRERTSEVWASTRWRASSGVA